MDREIRESRRFGSPLRTAVLLQRAGQLAEAIQALEVLWRGGGEEAEAAGDQLLGALFELEPEARLGIAGDLEALARDGLPGAQSLWLGWFPAASTIVGESEPIRRLRTFLYAHAGHADPILVTGESGTGHALSARALHSLSGRSGELQEAYAPASRRRLQRQLDEAHSGGTLYLSYANDTARWADFVPAFCRARDLRLVVGMNVSVAPRLRLEDKDVPACELLPLRDRLVDLPLLVGELLQRAGAPEAAEALPPHVLRDLAHHDWPGNVRELANHVARAVQRANAPEEVADHLVEDMYSLPGEQG
jgi:hypothetical protein